MILRLAHVEIGADDLDAARHFYVDVLGWSEHLREGDALYLRAASEFDVWSLKISRAAGPGLAHLSLRVSEAEDLDRLQTLHASLGLACERVEPGREPGVGGALRVLTPDGHQLAFVHDIDEIDLRADGGLRLPMRDLHRRAGVPPARIDHVNLRTSSMAVSLGYWIDQLAFSISELLVDGDDEPRIVWMRRRTGTHDVAFGLHDGPAFHHFAYTLPDAGAVIRAADVLSDARMATCIERGPGRHGVTNALFLYVKDPAGNRLELYSDDYVRDLDRPPIRWRPGDQQNWWESPPPPSFAQVVPILSAGWPQAAGAVA